MTNSQDLSVSEVIASLNSQASLEQAFDSLVAEFGKLSGHRSLPVEAEFRRIEGSEDHKAILWEADSFTADGLDYGVVVKLTGEEQWSRSVIVFPSADSTAPILVLLLHGVADNLSLIVADLIPLCECDNGVMDEVAMGYETFGAVPELPANFFAPFSRSPIIRNLRPGTPPSTVIHLMHEISALWIEYAMATTNDSDATTRQAVIKRRAEICQAHSDNEWVRTYLTQAFGKSLGEKLLTQVIFRQERSQAAMNTR